MSRTAPSSTTVTGSDQLRPVQDAIGVGVALDAAVELGVAAGVAVRVTSAVAVG
jgi:hypothetical protein